MNNHDMDVAQTIVYIAYWNDCIYESVPAPISIHRTMKGAYDAMKRTILEDYEEWLERRRWCDRATRKYTYDKHGGDKHWFIRKEEILE